MIHTTALNSRLIGLARPVPHATCCRFSPMAAVAAPFAQHLRSQRDRKLRNCVLFPTAGILQRFPRARRLIPRFKTIVRSAPWHSVNPSLVIAAAFGFSARHRVVRRAAELKCSALFGAEWNSRNPCLAFTRRLMARWSCSRMLFRYCTGRCLQRRRRVPSFLIAGIAEV